jgi:glycosyltransferase involved in cell wall biosynthesis
MKKSRIAVLIDWYLPGTKAGGPVRSVYSLVAALKEIYEFHILTVNHDLGSNISYKGIQPNTLFEENGVFYYYFSQSRLTSENVLSILKEKNYDLVYLNSFWSVPFSINIVRMKHSGLLTAPVLLAPRGMLGKGALSLKSTKKQVYLMISRALGWYKLILLHATQEQEFSDILMKFPKNRIRIAPNINSGTPKKNLSKKDPNELRMIYISRISIVKNLHFALELLKDISARFKIVYDIYGNIEDTVYWQECEKIISGLPKNISVHYKGEIEFEKVQNVLANYHCIFLPTLNENFGHSIVESLLSGCAAIISDQTPWTDLEANEAGFAFSLHEKGRFIKAIEYYASLDEASFRDKSEKSCRYITKKIDLSSIIQQYRELFDGAIKN